MSNLSTSVELSTLAPSSVDSTSSSTTTPASDDSSNNGAANVLAGISATTDMSEEEIDNMMSVLKSRLEIIGRRIKKDGDGFFDQSTWKWKLAVIFLSVWGVVMPTYVAYHFGGSANDLSRQSLMAARWSNYYTWILDVCPAEEARNMSTPECKQAQSQTTPSVKRPNAQNKRSVGMKLAKHFWSNLNASASLQADIDSTDNFCLPSGTSNSSAAFAFYSTCSSLLVRPSHPLEAIPKITKRMPSQRLVLPIPPSVKTRVEKFYSSPLGVVGSCLLAYLYFMAFFFEHKWYQLVRRSGYKVLSVASWNFRPAEGLSVPRQLCWVGVLVAAASLEILATVRGTKTLGLWLAKDELFNKCLTNEKIPPSTSCRVLADLLGNVVLTDKINIASLWRGYIGVEVERYDNTSEFLFGALWSVWICLLAFARVWECFQPWKYWSSHGNQRLPFAIGRQIVRSREVGIQEKGSLSEAQPLIKLS